MADSLHPRGSASARRWLLSCLSWLAALALAPAALADAIDGEWCHDKQSLRIEGPTVRTIGGTTMDGEYTRHRFRYTVPANEPEAGTMILMVLRSEEVMDLTRVKNGVESPVERWVRCRPVS